jgi:UDP-N-acetylmuramate dehydrogenase
VPVRADVALADLTTLRLGGPARRLVAVSTEVALIDAVRSADASGEPLLVVAGGSNLVVADEGFDGTVVHVVTRGVEVRTDVGSGTDGARADRETDVDARGARVDVTVAAGEPWDDLVARAVAEGWSGIEALSGIPGSTGATPIQNVGAYGQEVADTVVRLRAWDRRTREVCTIQAADCGFGYRTSAFKGHDRYVVLDVTFRLFLGADGAPIRYAELARHLDTEPGATAPAADVRRAVLDLRRRKGMVLDPGDHDTWSAGSFFTNPVLDPSEVPEGAPAWPQPDGRVKTSAAWLIDHAGFGKGHAGPGGRVTLSTKHPLALTNRGGARTADLLALAREVRDGVRSRFGVELVNEPTLVGCVL